MQKIGIIGFGPFGQTLFKLLANDFEVYVYEKNKRVYHSISAGILRKIKIADTPRELFKETKVIFYCVPISGFEKIISDHQKFFDNHLLIDVMEVKMSALKIFRKFLTRKTFTRAILTHPLFSPQDIKDGLKDLSIVMHNYSATNSEYDFWKSTFKNLGLKIIELDPKKHDRLISQSLGITTFIARILNEIKFELTAINTNDVKKLLEIKESVCARSFESFFDLQNYNAFTKDSRLSLTSAFEKLTKKFIPEENESKSTSVKRPIYGIQGGKQSFSDLAFKYYLANNSTNVINSANAKISFFNTPDQVLKGLNRGDIDYGLFVLGSTSSGVADESLQAISKYKFKIVDKFLMHTKCYLMKKAKIYYKDIGTIMADSIGLLNCSTKLKSMYPNLKIISDKKGFDVSYSAKALGSGKLDDTIAILGTKELAELYNLEIIADDLSDSEQSELIFIVVKRR